MWLLCPALREEPHCAELRDRHINMTRNTSLALSTSRDTLAATPMPRIPCLGLGVPPACPDALALTRSASCSAHFKFSTRAAAHTKEKHFPRASRADVRPFARFRRGSSRRLLGEAVGRFSLKDDNAAVLRLSLRRPQSAAAHHTKYNIRATHWSLGSWQTKSVTTRRAT